METERVAMIVPSRAARKEPNQMLPMTKTNLPVLGSSGRGTALFSSLGAAPSSISFVPSASRRPLDFLSPSSGLVSEDPLWKFDVIDAMIRKQKRLMA